MHVRSGGNARTLIISILFSSTATEHLKNGRMVFLTLYLIYWLSNSGIAYYNVCYAQYIKFSAE